VISLFVISTHEQKTSCLTCGTSHKHWQEISPNFGWGGPNFGEILDSGPRACCAYSSYLLARPFTMPPGKRGICTCTSYKCGEGSHFDLATQRILPGKDRAVSTIAQHRRADAKLQVTNAAKVGSPENESVRGLLIKSWSTSHNIYYRAPLHLHPLVHHPRPCHRVPRALARHRHRFPPPALRQLTLVSYLDLILETCS
jgi:hypothetical protein